MRFSSAGFLSVAALMAQLSVAGTPASTPEQLGAVQAAIDFCTKLDANDHNRIERQAKLVLPDMTEERVAKARNKPEFQKACQTIRSVFNEFAVTDATRLCAAFPNKEPVPKPRR
jgi:hypothetical protein